MTLIDELRELEVEHGFRQIVLALSDIADGHETDANHYAEAEAKHNAYHDKWTVVAVHWGCVSGELCNVSTHLTEFQK